MKHLFIIGVLIALIGCNGALGLSPTRPSNERYQELVLYVANRCDNICQDTGALFSVVAVHSYDECFSCTCEFTDNGSITFDVCASSI
jgi:hypothetical protein